jgi:hypothetical protein
MKIHKALSNALDTDFETIGELVPVEEQNTAVKISEDAEADFEKSRTVLNDLITKGAEAIDDIHAIAQSNEEARSFEVLAVLIKTVGETTEKLMSVHEKKKKLGEMDIQGHKVADNGKGVNIDKAVFVGTTSDLLKSLREKDKNG